MLDTLKLSVRDKASMQKLMNSNLLQWVDYKEWCSKYDNEVINNKTTKEYKGISFYFYYDNVEIIFKLHHFFNDNLHNANDFTVSNCISILNAFKSIFNVDLNKLIVKNIEFGLNVISPIPIRDLMTAIQYHGKNQFRNHVGLVHSKQSSKENRKGKTSSYKIIKAYAKGLEFPEYSDKDNFRFEIKSKEAKYFNKLGIYTLHDLLAPSVYHRLAKELLIEYDNILFLDNYTVFEQLTLKEQEKIKKYNNPNHWCGIIKEYRNSFSRNKKKYYDLINKAEANIVLSLRTIIINKLKFLEEVQFPQ